MNQEKDVKSMDESKKGEVMQEIERMRREIERVVEERKHHKEAMKRLNERYACAVAWNERYVCKGIDCECGGGGGSKHRSRASEMNEDE